MGIATSVEAMRRLFAAAALGLPRWGEAGSVTGKRCGWSQNLGSASRRNPLAMPLGRVADLLAGLEAAKARVGADGHPDSPSGQRFVPVLERGGNYATP